MSRPSLVCLLVLVSGCAAKTSRDPAAPPAAAAQGYPNSYAAPPPSPVQPGGLPLSQAPAATASPLTPSMSGGAHDAETPLDLPSALARLDADALAIGATLGNCSTACRSLGSMERAVHVVCELTRDGDHARCDEARKKLRDARERVRNGCGVCEGGPRTDASAPDP